MRISDWSSDVCSSDLAPEKLFTWWSYRARDWQASDRGRRLDHVWASPQIASAAKSHRVHRASRSWQKPSDHRSEEHTSELQSLMRISYAVSCLKKYNLHFPILHNNTHPTRNRNDTQ